MHVMIAVDGTEASLLAAQTAADLFGSEAQYSVVSVNAPMPVTSLSPFGVTPALMALTRGDVDLGDPAEDHAEEAADLVDDAETIDSSQVEAIALHGSPGPAICELAAEREADVLVVGVHERGWLDKLFGPNVGSYIVDHAPCHVLVARSGA